MKRTVLVVEDDADVREMIQLVLETEGHRVITAPNGAAALELLPARVDEIGLILLDLVMPIMDGWTFLEKKSQSPLLSPLPAVVISAAQPSHPIMAMATAFLAKPVAAEALLAVVSQHVGTPAASSSRA
jgi:CheY-like chemotaxis protein